MNNTQSKENIEKSEKKQGKNNQNLTNKNEKSNKRKKCNNSNLKWFITVFVMTFTLSIFFSFVSANAISNLSIIPAIFILLLVIFIGIIFDIIGVAVTVADEKEFHAKASKRISGSKTSVKLIRNSAKVANFCADIVGDICGVLSGAISALIAVKVMQKYQIPFDLQFIISAAVASLTVTGKAIGKNIAQSNSNQIVHKVAAILNKLHLNRD